MRFFLPLLLSASFCLLAQKPTLTDIDQAQKQAAVDAQVNQRAIAQKQAASDAQQRRTQANQEAARLLALRLHDSNLVEATKAADAQEARMAGVEQTLTMLRLDKKQQEDDAREWHIELRNFWFAVAAILVGAGILGTISYYKAERRHKAEERGREDAAHGREVAAKTARIQDGKTDQIHTLVNSKLTTALKSQLSALKLALYFAHKASGKAGKHDPEDVAAVDAANQEIAELNTEIAGRLAATEVGVEAKDAKS